MPGRVQLQFAKRRWLGAAALPSRHILRLSLARQASAVH